MQNFIFDNKTKIIFGRNTEASAGIESVKYGKKVLLHYGSGSIKKSGLYDRVLRSLKEAGLEVFELGGVKPNPRLSLVYEGIKLCKEQNIDFILAVGGGSVIDSSKAISIGAKYDGNVWDFYTGKPVEAALPIGVILTIPAAGSESSPASVLTKEEGLYKRATGSDLIRPVFAIMNPELTFTLPPFQTACGVTDMFAHVLERYFTNEKNVDFTDELSEATMRTIIKNAKKVIKEPENYSARAEIMWAGSVAHNGLLGTGRIEDWASHDIEHELSAIYDIAHGAGLAVIFPSWMKYVYKHDIMRFVRFAHNVFGAPIDFNDYERTALEGIERLKEFFNGIGLKTSLSELNIDNSRFKEMAKKATEAHPLGNFVKLKAEDVEAIYNLAR